MKRRVYFYPEIDSTNNAAKKLCNENKGGGTLVVADCQTAGKGRLGRSFASPAGTGLYLTAVYELTGQEKNFELLPALAGLAVRDTLYNMFGLESAITVPMKSTATSFV